MRLPKDIRRLLDASGIPWEVRKGKRHATLWIAGRPVTAVGGTPSDHRSHRNTLGRIRRALRAAAS